MSWQKVDKEEVKAMVETMKETAEGLVPSESQLVTPKRRGRPKIDIWNDWSLPEIMLLKELRNQGYNQTDTRSFFFSVLGKTLDLPTLRALQSAKPTKVFPEKQVGEAEQQVKNLIMTVRNGYFDSFEVDVERCRAVRLNGEMLMVERMARKDLDSQTLRGFIKDMWEREQIMKGMPTTINKDIKQLTDEELIKKVYELNPDAVRRVIKGDESKSTELPQLGAEQVSTGTATEEQGGATEVLEAPPATTEGNKVS